MTALIIIAIAIWLRWSFREKRAPDRPLTKDEIEELRIEGEKREAESIQIALERQREKQEWRDKYNRYLRSPKWQRVRKKAFGKAGNVCEICGKPAKQLHHIKYPKGHKMGDFKRENYKYLQVLCAKCHMEKHGK